MRLEPALQRHRLGVVVTVDEHGACGAGHAALAEHRGVAARLEHAPVESSRAECSGEPLAGDAHSLGLLAHGIASQELDEPFDDRAAARREETVERRPVSHRPGDYLKIVDSAYGGRYGLDVTPASLRDLVERRGRDDRDRAFCFFEDSVITFGALDTTSNRLANGLSGLGIGPGDRVAVMLPNHPDHVNTVVALAKLGATHVPVNVHAKAIGLRYQLEHAELRAVVADVRYRDELSRALRGTARRVARVAR